MTTIYRFVNYEGDAGHNVLAPTQAPEQAAAFIQALDAGDAFEAGAYSARALSAHSDMEALACMPWRQVADADVRCVYVIRKASAINASQGAIVTAYACRVVEGRRSKSWAVFAFWRGDLNELAELASTPEPDVDAAIAEAGREADAPRYDA